MLTYPLALTEFFDLLPIEKSSIAFRDNLDVGQSGGGEVVVASVGPSLWAGEIDLAVMDHVEAARIAPLINVLARGGSFLVADPHRPWPQLDPQGVMLTGAAPVLAQVGATSREISLSGLPALYPISRGDLLSFAYNGRIALHEVVEDALANTAGVTGLMQVSPAVRPGATLGTPVQLVWPCCKARMVGKDVKRGTTQNTITTGASFAWVQTLRP